MKLRYSIEKLNIYGSYIFILHSKSAKVIIQIGVIFYMKFVLYFIYNYR